MLCLCWTQALRARLAVRSIGQARLPFTVTIVQLFTTTIVFVLLFFTRDTWSRLLPDGGLQVGLVVGPLVAALITRDQQLEGRSLPRYLKSLVVYATAAVTDRLGRIQRERRIHTLTAVEWNEIT